MPTSQRSARRSSPLNPNKTPESIPVPLQPISANTASRRMPARTPGKTEAGRTPTGPLSATRRRVRYTPGRVVKPTTPHGIRAFEQRRAGLLTPGRARRQSGRLKRDTPRDLLRQLSRALPHPEPTPRKDELLSVAEDEDSEDDLSLESPRLSFGVYNDDKSTSKRPRTSRLSIEKGRRAYSDAHRMSMEASLLAADMEDSDVDDEDAPITKLLDIDISDDEISMPTPTFGERDNMGDTAALRQLMTLTRSPRTPEDDRGPATPTADLSFALDIPNISEPQILVADDDDDDLGNDFDGGFDLVQPEEEDELTVNPQDLDISLTSRKAPLELGTIRHPLLNIPSLTNKQSRKAARKHSKIRAPRRDGLPKGVIKRVASSFLRSPSGKKSRLKNGALDAIMNASDWFFEEAAKDLAAYAEHGGRKTIDESDVLMLARRQKVLTSKSTLFSLAQRFLPGELLKDVRNVQRPDGGA